MPYESEPERRLTRALIFFADDIEKIDSALATYREASRSQCNLLVDIEGHVVTQVGTLEGVHPDTIGALVAACYAATREIARMIGEEEFATLGHQGRDECIQLTLVGERTILATVYSPHLTTAGLVSFYLGAAVAKVRAVVEAVRTRAGRPALEEGFGREIGGSFDALFGEES